MTSSYYAVLLLIFLYFHANAIEANPLQNENLTAKASHTLGKQIPYIFEEINHVGACGLWTELVNNRGFEAEGKNIPSKIYPWTIIGDESLIHVSIDQISCFEHNKNALKMELHCDSSYSCPPDGVGISNPGFWGMNIEKGKKYKVVFYVRSTEEIDLKVSFIGSKDGVKQASTDINLGIDVNVSTWKRVEHVFVAKSTNHNSNFQITTNGKGIVWLDQISVMPLDTYKGHGFLKDHFQMVAELKPKTFTFPGGYYVEGGVLKNAFQWKQTIGPWENRSGHYNDVWDYWTDDGFGFFEGLQLAEDLNAMPIWVFYDGISHYGHVNISNISPFVQEALDGLEFARGSPTSKWGSIRAAMGHSKPFDLRYVTIGNEECKSNLKPNHQGNHSVFYDAIKHAYPDIQIISNCDASEKPLSHPADVYDYHQCPKSANDMLQRLAQVFDHASHFAPKENAHKWNVIGATGQNLDPKLRQAESNKMNISVNQDGSANFKTLTEALNSIPTPNSRRVNVFIAPGLYREKVVIPKTLPFITLIGDATNRAIFTGDDRASTIGSDGKPLRTFNSGTVTVNADYFIAVNIVFENTAKPLIRREGNQSVALRTSGNKSAFYNCAFHGFQNTLYDHEGFHYFKDCFIQGTVDFVFGNGRSLYEGCVLKSLAQNLGYITAQSRPSLSTETGFSFVNSNITGTGQVYLGRPWGNYSRVVFSYAYMNNIVLPKGWDDIMSGNDSHKTTVFYGEYKCSGPGSNFAGRAPWVRRLTDQEAQKFIGIHFIEGDTWTIGPSL